MNRLIQLNNSKGSFIAAVLLFYLIRPYFVWHGLLGSNMIIIPISLLLGLLFFINNELTKKNILLFLYFVAIFISHTLIRGRNLNYFISVIPFAFLPFGNKFFTKSVYNNFLTIYCLITSISVIVWILHLANIAPILGTIAPLNKLKSHDYILYPLLVSIPNNIRFCGVFDEPGVIGTLSAMLLCIQKFNFKDKRTIVILISGLCSLSLFFYILFVVTLIVYYSFDKKNIIKIAFVIIIIFTAFQFIQNNDILNEIIGSRLEWDSESGKFAGDNRTNDKSLYFFNSILGSNEFWFGLEDNSLFLEYMIGESNIYMLLILNGFLFCLAYLLFIIIYGLSKKRKNITFILFIIIFLATIYQRPSLFNPEYIFLWTCMARIDEI